MIQSLLGFICSDESDVSSLAGQTNSCEERMTRNTVAQLNTGHSDRLCLPSYNVSQREAAQHYLKIRPLPTAHGKREGKWKTDRASPNKQEPLLSRICSLLLVWAAGRLYSRSRQSWLALCCHEHVRRLARENEPERIKPETFTISVCSICLCSMGMGRTLTPNGIFGAVKCLQRQICWKMFEIWRCVLHQRHHSFTHPWFWVLRIVVCCH